MPFENFAVVHFPRPDDELEIPAFRESFLKKFVDLFPAAPIFDRVRCQMRGKFGHFKGELGKGRSRNGRKHPNKDIAFEEDQLIEPDSDSEPTENLEICEFEAIQLTGPCGTRITTIPLWSTRKERTSTHRIRKVR